MNKADAVEPEDMARKKSELEQACGKKVFVISAVAKQGLFDCLREVNQYITRDRKTKETVLDPVEEAKSGVWSPL